jgi:hypothetical protein
MANVATLMEVGRCGSDCERIAQAATEALSTVSSDSGGTTKPQRSNQEATALAVAYWRWRAAISGSSYSGE